MSFRFVGGMEILALIVILFGELLLVKGSQAVSPTDRSHLTACCSGLRLQKAALAVFGRLRSSSQCLRSSQKALPLEEGSFGRLQFFQP